MARPGNSAQAFQRVRAIPRIPARPEGGHKGTFGRVLVIAGSVGMAGAPSLVGRAALRSGAGLVIIACPAPVQPTVAGLCPCATTIALPATRDGRLDPCRSARWFEEHGWFDAEGALPDALVIGPGLGRGSDAHARAVWELIDRFRGAGCRGCVVDADALNLAGRSPRDAAHIWNRRPHPATIFTPHPGELARLHGVSVPQVQRDREGFALRTARRMASNTPASDVRPVVVLKGSGTLVTDGTRLYTNHTGNPGMASGGTGDVLSGILGALVGQKIDVFEAAVLGVYVHGRAGDAAAKRIGQIALTATDLIEALPDAWKGVDPSLGHPRSAGR